MINNDELNFHLFILKMPVIFSWESIQILNKKTRSFINVRDTLHSIAVPGVFLSMCVTHYIRLLYLVYF